ncbi:uncharacterized protein ISCGN_007271 [Ixodes scapularis]
MITVAGTELPWLLRYPGTRHKVVLLLNRVEACFNCRKTGHRQDVCPQKRRNLCFRCGEEHPPPQEGQPTTCAPVCIICARAHKTGSSNCKFRFAKQQVSQRPHPLSNPDLNIGQNFKHQSRDRNRQHETLTRGDKREASSSFPPLLRSRSKSATRSSQSRDRQKDQQRSSSKRRDPKNPWTKPGERAIKWQEDPEKQALRNQVREQAIVIERMQSQISVLGNKIASLTQTQHPVKAKLALEQKERLNKVEARADRLEATSMDVVKNLQQTKEEMMEAIKALQVQIQGQNIEVENIRVLGLHISNTPSNIAALGRLESSVHQVARMIRRIANKRRGMEEHDLHKLLQAFVITKIIYAFPYLRLKKAEEQKIDILIRHAYKTALGLPKFTANEKLLALGVHNTFSELKEAHLTTQTARLSSTPPGRMILDRLGIEGEPMADHPGPVPGYIRKKIRIKPLPKNMNPQTQQGRREARARAMHRHLQRLQDVIYVDAANYQDSRHRFAICGVPHPRDSDAATPLIAATVFTKNAETAEEAAIAAAVAFTEATTIVSDSKYAITNYAKGRISLAARNILENVAETSPLREIDLVWVPAHAGNPGNEAAHAQARVRAGRAVDSPIPEATGEPLTSYHDHTTHFKLRRRKFPPPHRSLSREQQVAWRRLQTNTSEVMDQIFRTSDSAKFGKCRTFAGKFGKDSAKIRQMSAHARERDGANGALDCKWTPCSRAVIIVQC